MTSLFFSLKGYNWYSFLCVCVKCIHLLLVFHLLMGLITFDWTGQNYLCIRSCYSNSFLPAVLLESNYRIHHSQWWLDHRQPTFIHSKMNHYYSWMIIDIWESWNRNQNKQVQLKGSTDFFFKCFQATIFASDNSNPEKITSVGVTINVYRDRSTPQFSVGNQTMTVSENAPIGTSVTRLTATDNDKVASVLTDLW